MCDGYGYKILYPRLLWSGYTPTKAVTIFGVETKFKHLDTTSMNVYGKYDRKDEVGLVEFGYSKEKLFSEIAFVL